MGGGGGGGGAARKGKCRGVKCTLAVEIHSYMLRKSIEEPKTYFDGNAFD